MDINDKILITGGSGFIGTNLIEFLILKGFKNIINFDFNKPKIPTHYPYWVNIDIRNEIQLKEEFKRINPNYIIHLAARTDLSGKSIDDYSSNTIGTKNLIDLSILYKPKFFVHTSTRLVNINGFKPTDYAFHNPDTLYGESKSISESYFKNVNFNYVILRPTSLWGPYFGEPFFNFFKLISKGLYFHPSFAKIYKTMGYVENSCSQIFNILHHEKQYKSRILYIGDPEPMDVYYFSKLISREFKNILPPIKLPYIFSYPIFLFCSLLLGKYSPVNIKKLNNIVSESIYDIELPINDFVTLENGIIKTVEWMKCEDEA